MDIYLFFNQTEKNHWRLKWNQIWNQLFLNARLFSKTWELPRLGPLLTLKVSLSSALPWSSAYRTRNPTVTLSSWHKPSFTVAQLMPSLGRDTCWVICFRTRLQRSNSCWFGLRFLCFQTDACLTSIPYHFHTFATKSLGHLKTEFTQTACR